MVRKVFFIILACGLAACVARPENVMLPVVATAPGTSRVDMIVATTRRPYASQGEMYSGDRGSKLTFANIEPREGFFK
jgi:esterase/lipase superfamily enzyme